MITYLIAVGFTPLQVGVIRFVTTVFELSATWIAPWLMRRIGVVRCGMWSLSWQMVWLAAGAGWFFSDFQGRGTNSVAAAMGLVVGVAFSRVGLWSYDLCAQRIVQDVRGPSPLPIPLRRGANLLRRRSKVITADPSPPSRLPSRTCLSLLRT